MSLEQRITNLENNFKIITTNVNNISQNLSNLNENIKEIQTVNNKLDNLLSFIGKNKSENNNINSQNNINLINNSNFVDNPFIEEANAQEEMITDSEEENEKSSNSMDISETNQKKRKKYKIQNPLYFYYEIEGKVYKYTCKNKYRKNILDFKCTDTHCKAQGLYYKQTDEFKPLIFTTHIPYDDHSYIIDNFMRINLKKNEYIEDDFKNGNVKKK